MKDQLRAEFVAGVKAERIPLDLGWSEPRIAGEFDAFVSAVHDHLHELALSAQPMGLHTFGQGADEKWRIAQVLTLLGKDFWEGVADPANPAKLAFTLWSVEAMRHFGLLEAQALWALGVEPVWDAGGRVTGVTTSPT